MFRGEYSTAFDDLDCLRKYLLRIAGQLLGIWDEGLRRAEEKIPKKHNLVYDEIRLAQYDPPYTPPYMRKNELHISLIGYDP